jgi:hypothetical protein
LSGVPEGLFEPREKKPTKISSTGLARYRMNARDVGDGVHAEVTIDGRVYRVSIREMA